MIMQRKAITAGLMLFSALVSGEPYGPFNVDGGKETCHETTGTEIKKSQAFEATGDRYFQNFNVSVLSGWSRKGDATCSIESVDYKEIKSKTADGYEIITKVPYRYTVYAHSDCGTSPVNFGKTISIECTVSAELTKYSH